MRSGLGVGQKIAKPINTVEIRSPMSIPTTKATKSNPKETLQGETADEYLQGAFLRANKREVHL
jgi:hypothetical protein